VRVCRLAGVRADVLIGRLARVGVDVLTDEGVALDIRLVVVSGADVLADVLAGMRTDVLAGEAMPLDVTGMRLRLADVLVAILARVLLAIFSHLFLLSNAALTRNVDH
jgi:hypothetical protein